MKITHVLVVMAIAAGAHAGAQTPPSLDKLPMVNTVTDRERPDYRYPQPWAGETFTIVAVMDTACEACSSSVAFYKRLAEHRLVARERGTFVLVARDGIWPLVEHIRKHPDGFQRPRVVGYPDDDRFAVRELPTLLVFDGPGRRRGEWRGPLTAEDERRVLSLIEELSKEERK